MKFKLHLKVFVLEVLSPASMIWRRCSTPSPLWKSSRQSVQAILRLSVASSGYCSYPTYYPSEPSSMPPFALNRSTKLAMASMTLPHPVVSHRSLRDERLDRSSHRPADRRQPCRGAEGAPWGRRRFNRGLGGA